MKTSSQSCHSLSAKGGSETKELPLDIQRHRSASKSHEGEDKSQGAFFHETHLGEMQGDRLRSSLLGKHVAVVKER